MADWRWEDLILCIPKLKRYYHNKLKKQKVNSLAERLSWHHTILTVSLIITVLGIIIFLGAKYDIPILNKAGDVGDIKYLFGVDKFNVMIEPKIIKNKGDNFVIPFSISSYEQKYVSVIVYFRPYEDNIFTPSFSYKRETILIKGESKDNIVYINVTAPLNPGRFEICIDIDDNTFFSFNKYNKCPSLLEVN